MEDIQVLLERPKLYDNIDGSSELMLGFMLIGFTLFQLVGAHAPQDSPWNKVYALYIFVALLVTGLIYGRKAIKNLITYRRTGFVNYRKPNVGWLGLICFAAACVAGGLAFLTVRRSEIDLTVLVTIGLGVFMTAAYTYGIARQTRWKWAVAGTLMISAYAVAMLPSQLASAPIGQPWLPAAFNRRLLGSLFWCETCCGLILLVSGSVSLALYILNTRRAEAE